VIDFSGETNLWWFERIVGWELYLEIEYTILVWRLGWTHYGSDPVEEVVSIFRSSTAVGRCVLRQILPLLLDALLGCHGGRREEEREGETSECFELLLSHTIDQKE